MLEAGLPFHEPVPCRLARVMAPTGPLRWSLLPEPPGLTVLESTGPTSV